MSVTAEVVRGLVILLLTVNIGFTGSVMRLHYKAWKVAPPKLGLLPLHVFAISLAQLFLLAGAAIGILDDLENPISFKTLFYVMGSVLTLVALQIISKFQRLKIASAKGLGGNQGAS